MINEKYIIEYADQISEIFDLTSNHSEKIQPFIEDIIHDVITSIEDSFVIAIKTNQTKLFIPNLESVLKLIRETKIRIQK